MRTAGSRFVAGQNGRLAALGFMFAFAAAVAGTQSVLAQESSEVPVGTFQLGNPHDGFFITEPPAGVPESKDEAPEEGSGRWFFERLDQSGASDSADSLYGEALDALKDGRAEDAQRLFERLVATAPRSAHAAEARQHLAKLYNRVETGSTGTAAPASPAQASETGRPVAWADATASGISAPLSPAALQRVKVSPSLDGQFLAEAGDRIFFSAGSAVLGARARGVIQAQARFLKQHLELSAAVEGHADDGALPDAETVSLSEQRAAVVRERLIAEGIDAERLVAFGRGRTQRVSDCPQPECSAQNRRVVTILLSARIGDLSVGRRASKEQPLSSPTQ